MLCLKNNYKLFRTMNGLHFLNNHFNIIKQCNLKSLICSITLINLSRHNTKQNLMIFIGHIHEKNEIL